MGGAMFHRREQ